MAGITLESIAAAGVVGAGGAGFPTHAKLAHRASTVIINGAECEPLLHKDKELLRHYGEAVVEALAAAMAITGAARGVVAVKDKYADLAGALADRLGAGQEIVLLRDAYPAGDEFVLVYDVTGQVIPPGGLPLHVGAVVMNVETAVNVAASAERPVTEKFLSVAGAVVSPMTLRVPVGVSLRQCVEAAGGPTVPDPCYLVGGVMMGRLAATPAETVDKTTGAVIVLPGNHPLARRYRRTGAQMDRIARSACDQCSFCTELCPRYLLGHPLEPHRAMRSRMFNLVGEPDVLGAAFCCECNLCSLYACPEDLDPRGICGAAKRRLAAAGRRWERAPFRPERPRLHLANRRAPTGRLMAKLGLTGFRNVCPLVEEGLDVRRVGLKLKQHAGAPCRPVVAVGEKVAAGQVVAQVPHEAGRPALGAPVHASIDGEVAAIEEGTIWIER